MLTDAAAIGLENTVASLLGGSCTSCGVKQDMSNYWHPMLYFKHASGDFEPVKQSGGMLVYVLRSQVQQQKRGRLT